MPRLLFLCVWLPNLLCGQPLYPDLSEITGLWGYRDSSGAWVVAPGYHAASPFVAGRALVTVDEQKYIGPNGGVFPPYYRVAKAQVWRPQHLIDSAGRILWSLPVGYQADPWVLPNPSGFPVRDVKGRYGFFNLEGELIQDFHFKRAWSFSQGLAAVEIYASDIDSIYYGLNQGLQDSLDFAIRRWKRLQKTQNSKHAHKFPLGGLRVMFLNENWKVKGFLPARYYPPDRQAFRFSEEGLIPVWDFFDQAHGLLDREMRLALPARYERLGLVSEGAIFAVRRPDFQAEGWMRNQDHQSFADSLFIGYIGLAGEPVFSMPISFLESKECKYQVFGRPMTRGEGIILLTPNRCQQVIILRVSADGRLVGYAQPEQAAGSWFD